MRSGAVPQGWAHEGNRSPIRGNLAVHQTESAFFEYCLLSRVSKGLEAA